MGDAIRCSTLVESYVSSASTASQQDASIEALVVLLKTGSISLEALVREMEMYLTTTDSTLRSRGILLLGELLSKLVSTPLETTALRTLIIFFSERLADWKALRGALVGCLALLRRENDVGKVDDTEAKAVAESYLKHLQVQCLGQHDRKLSFQLLECLLDRHSCAVTDLGDQFVYGICEAIDGEKDPQCLLAVFSIMEILGRVYPDSSGPLVIYAEEVFEILGSYFPIHFTHAKDGNDELKREELSRALMLAFASTPLFEPFSIPLLLEKVSSSLSSAKLDSFRYLSYCTVKYGHDRMVKHAVAIWSCIKESTYFSLDYTLPMETESGVMNFEESDVTRQGFLLLREVILQNHDFVHLVTEDSDINTFLNLLNEYKEFDDITLSVKQRLHAVGRILSSCAELSIASCNKVFEHFFPLLMDGVDLSADKQYADSYSCEDYSHIKLGFGALYLSINLLAACRDLTVSMDSASSLSDFAHHTLCAILNKFSGPLVLAFISVIRSDNLHRAFLYLGVKGLEIMATFSGTFPFVSNLLYYKILSWFLEIITSDGSKEFLWKSALRALVEIGLFINKFWGSQKAVSFETTVVEKIASIISSDGSALPFSLKWQVAFEIGEIRKDFMSRVVRAVDEAIDSNLTEVYIHGNHECIDLTIKLFDAYCQRILPWSIKIGGAEYIRLNLALRILDIVENTSIPSNLSSPEIGTDLLSALSNAMKKTVSCCSERSQEMIINKATNILASCDLSNLMELKSGIQDKMQYTCTIGKISNRDECLSSFFAAVVIALHPQTVIPSGELIVHLFMIGLLNGHIPSAHALGSLVNKLPLVISETASVECLSVSKVLDTVFNIFSTTSLYNGTLENDANAINPGNLKSKSPGFQSLMNTIIGLAWIGKGLLMRGHEKIKDVSMTLLSFLAWDHKVGDLKDFQHLVDAFDDKESYQLRKCAGDAIHVIMSDSEECLNQNYHAVVKPLYKQRFFSIVMPILLSLVVNSESTLAKFMVHRALAHVVCNTPLAAVLGEAKKLVPMILECLSMLGNDAQDKGIIYNVLLVLSGILLEERGREAVVENTPGIVHQLAELTSYPHMMAIRETAIQCLVAVSELPHTRIYPMRTKVVRAISKALDDPKRIVRQEAVRCRQAWASIA